MAHSFAEQIIKKWALIIGGKRDMSPPFHELEATEETLPSHMKDPGFHYTA
ncbi:unnamed protein product [Spirodela intermedia]|uniref:Uncharacterized protein n=1 Tax=Spirodela intermedia TaxID=51605 RepID=A0A7I8K9Q0_SPIIN|nr:unnamed protein product [Spirodela intermedia]